MAIVQQKLPPQCVATANFSQDNRKRVLDLAKACIQYQYSSMELDQIEYQRRILAVLKAKNDLEKISAETDKIPAQSSPDEGHLPGKVGVGLGYRKNSLFTEVNLRPAYHDLCDPDVGYAEGSQLNLFEVKGRYYEKNGLVKLQKLHFIDLVFLAPRDFFFKPVSWKLNTGFDREIIPDGSEHLLYRIDIGGGFSYKRRELGLFYALFETDLNVTGHFQEDFALGAGLTIGVLRNLTDCWKLSLQGQTIYYVLGESHKKYRGTLAQNFKVTRNTGIGLRLNLERSFGFYRSEISARVNYYF